MSSISFEPIYMNLGIVLIFFWKMRSVPKALLGT